MSDRPLNFFALFDLPVGFAIDPEILNARYRDLLAVTHAERLAAADDPDPDPDASARATRMLDDAYRILRDPLTRAEYLLGLRDDPALPELAAADGGENGLIFLMERMELRETLAEAASCADPDTAVARVLTQLAEESAALDKTLQGLFADPSPENLRLAREIVRQLRFLGTCRRDAEDRRPGPPLHD